MGVPKFFRYISERYPCLSELAREQSIPEFDNLYLDMNGIIHNCSHPDDSNVHLHISEEDMFKDIFNYIDKLFFLIKPQKLFFMAIDGVAPRAKMNQQRSRRFRSAKDAEVLESKALRSGLVRENERFDSNCITPGTEFMERLHEALRYFIKNKISADPLWQKCRIILSGHNAPGEGEHKIMDYIRYMKSKKNYNPNTRHCLYGLDADLIVLGLCTHELHFVVLREEVKFGKKTKHTSVEETRFFLLHLSLLRDYLELEFDELRKIDPSFNIAKLIDDWVLMGFMVGNDFIPHLPCLHISSNALPLLYKTYIKVYPTLGGNLNEDGKLNLERLEKYFEALSEVEFEIFQENYAELKYFEPAKSKNGIDEAFDFDTEEITNANLDSDMADMIESSRQFFEDGDDDSMDEEQHKADEFETYKRNYYMSKLNQNDMSNALKREQAICYITALQWILDYYYRGVQSWDWYYPHHYAPFISDLKNFKDYVIRFNMGKPFLPFQQLLAVLPAASKALLPAAYHDLMTDADSKLISFYPKDFETDLNGKKNEWEAVVLIPFIDEKLLLEAMEKCDKNLTPSERKRNSHGPMYQYDYCAKSQGTLNGVANLPAIPNVNCTEKSFWSKDIVVSSKHTACIELPNAARSVYFPGFPTMKHLKFDFEIRNAFVKVFDYPSRNENLILKPIMRQGFDDVYTVADKFLNKEVFIGWPHMVRAKVEAVANKDKHIDMNGTKNNNNTVLFNLHVKSAQEHLEKRMGVDIADYSVMVYARTHVGSTLNYGSQGRLIRNDTWSSVSTIYPAQALVFDIPTHSTATNMNKIEQLYPVGSKIFFIGNPYFGSEGKVLDPMLMYSCGRLKVNITVLPEPNLHIAKMTQANLEDDYIQANQATSITGLNPRVLGRLTSAWFVYAGERRKVDGDMPKHNIGLQFRLPKMKERIGYARREFNQWFYSSKALAIVKSYCDTFPCLLQYIRDKGDLQDCCFEADLYPNNVGEGCIEKMVDWLKAQDSQNAEIVPCGAKGIERETVVELLKCIDELKAAPVKTVTLQVKPHLLLKPNFTLPSTYKAKWPIKLFDRVVIVKTTYGVPLGAKGTVVGIYPISDPNPVRLECVGAVETFYEVLFDKEIPNGCDMHGIAPLRVSKVPEGSVLLIFNRDNNAESQTRQAANNAMMNPMETKPRVDAPLSKQRNHQEQLEKPTTSRAPNAPNKPQQQQQRQQQPHQPQQQQQQQMSKFHPFQQQQHPPFQPMAQKNQNTMSAKGVEEFWMPMTAAPKPAYTIMSKDAINKPEFVPRHMRPQAEQQQQAQAQKPKQQQQQAQPQKQQPQQAQQQVQNTNLHPQPKQSYQQMDTAASTQALKSLLGVGMSTDKGTKPNTTQSFQTLTQPAFPPPPPTCWRNEAQNLQPMAVQQANFSQPIAAQHATGLYQMPCMYGNVPLPVSTSLIQPYPNAPFYPMQAPVFVPNGQADMNSQSDVSQKGAFVPLQTLRNAQTKSNAGAESKNDTIEQNLNKISLNDSFASSVEATTNSLKSPACETSSTNITKSESTEIKLKRTTRPPKIGAKFDFVN